MKKRTNEIITPEQIYVSVLKARKECDETGEERMVPVAKTFEPTSSAMLNETGELLAQDSSISITDLVKHFGIEVDELWKVFRKLTKMNPMAFIIAYRILQAQEWLECTDLSMREVAQRSGYKSAADFAVRFRRSMGCTPTEYREENRPTDYRQLYVWE